MKAHIKAIKEFLTIVLIGIVLFGAMGPVFDIINWFTISCIITFFGYIVIKTYINIYNNVK